MVLTKSKNGIIRFLVNSSLDYFLRNVDPKLIRCILITGSAATDEVTIIKSESYTITSDIEFDVFVKIPYYFIASKRFPEYSRSFTETFRRKGIHTKVLFHPQLEILHFLLPKIYLYEYRVASELVYGRLPNFVKKNTNLPTAEDALELVFSTIADYLLARDNVDTSPAERIYYFAKRSLTLLYALLIVRGLCVYGYGERISRAVWAVKQKIPLPINNNDMNLLSALTRFKLSGSVDYLAKELGCDDISALSKLLEEFVKDLIYKVLYSCLALSINDNFDGFSVNDHGGLPRPILRSVYLRKVSVFKYLFNILLMPSRFRKIREQSIQHELGSFCVRRFSVREILNAALLHRFLLDNSSMLSSKFKSLGDGILGAITKVDTRELIRLREDLGLF